MGNIFTFENLTYTIPGKVLFKGISGEIKSGDKIGLIGLNGTGKSTLVRILFCEEKYDTGSISKLPGKLGYIPQQIDEEIAVNMTVSDFAASLQSHIYPIYKKLKRLEAEQDFGEKYSTAIGDFQEANGYTYLADLEVTLKRYGFATDALEKKFLELSEGQKRLVYITSIILLNPAILVLDEPTNHVDVETKDAMINLLHKFKGAMLAISHDRELLSVVCNKVWELENGRLEKYKGNWEAYKDQHQARLTDQIRTFEENAKELERLASLLKEYQRLAKLYPDPKWGPKVSNVKRTIERIENVQPDIRPSFEKNKIRAKLEAGGKYSQFALRIGNLNVTVGEKCLFNSFDLEVRYGEKVELKGRNGSGKSTLLKIIQGKCDYAKVSGNVILGPSSRIGVLDQMAKFEDENITLYDYIRSLTKGADNVIYGTMRKYLFNKQQSTEKLSALSGGERTRLHLIHLLEGNFNFLILDEPTNNLDTHTIEVLENLLVEFKGTVLFVSHDKYFAKKVGRRIVVLV